MKNLSRITYVVSLVMTFAFAFTLGACVATNYAPSSSAAQNPTAQTSSDPSGSHDQYASDASESEEQPNELESSHSEEESDSSYSSNWKDEPTSPGSSSNSDASDGYSVDVGEDDGSYADDHLNSGTYQDTNITVTRDGTYTDKEHVALYIHTYGTVPSNYVSKTKARKAGWVSTKGNLWDVLPGMSIGGGGFYNDDGMMPDAPGREWFECDIDYEGGFRNAKRIVYSDDGLIYYTDDHYKTFERLY